MLDKFITMPGSDENGNPLVYSLFPRTGGKVKTAAKRTYHPAIKSYIDKLHPRESKLYVLVNALGAGETYGSNRNGDYFGKAWLRANEEDRRSLGVYAKENSMYANKKFGYKTFLDAGVFRHHQNQDITKSMGKVVLSVFNERMQRVELIIEIDRADAIKLGHGTLIQMLDNGRTPAVSMGAKVPYDQCRVCKHKSRRKEDKCKCVREIGLNKYTETGEVVCVDNPYPRFFDLSFVLIGAEPCSFAMEKLASLYAKKGETEPMLSPNKTKEAALGNLSKLAEKIKLLPARSAEVLRNTGLGERRLPESVMRGLCSVPPRSALTTAMAGGVVLSPSEFQRVILKSVGRSHLADDYHRRNITFGPVNRVDRSLSIGNSDDFSPSIRKLVVSIMPERSMFSPLIGRRVLTKLADNNLVDTSEEMSTPLLDKVAAGYNGYRLDVVEKIAHIVEEVTRRDATLMAELVDVSTSTTSVKEKTAGIADKLLLLGLLPVAYLYGAHVNKVKSAGGRVGPISNFIENHPIISSAAIAGISNMASKGKFKDLLG